MSSQRTALIVDDERNIAEPLAAYLEKQGYAVLTAASGRDGLSLAGKADIILLDLMLPDMTGEAVCRKIRETSGVPIIMMTAKTSEESQLEGLSLGADDYVTKPFSLKLLAARMDTVLRRLPQSEPPQIFADVPLTATERKIVGALSRRPNRIFTREELIAVAFDDEYDGFDRVIDTHIKNLRKKIGAQAVKTVRGLGYQWGYGE